MNNQPMLITFLRELFVRFIMKSPKYFKIWQLISFSLVIITGVPEAMQLFNITMPPAIEFFANKAIALASSGALFMSLMTTQSPTVGVTDKGDVVKKTNEVRLPFTAAVEAKAAAKMPDAPKIIVKGKDDPEDESTAG